MDALNGQFRSPRRLVARAVAAVVTIGVSSAGYQVAADARQRRRFPPPGRLVDIGGRRIHLMDAGEGNPAVVIVPALGESVLGWVPVWQALAGYTRAVVYDRAGLGWSDPAGPGRRTYDEMAEELHSSLAAAGIPAPFLLMGHSIGGIITRRFAVRYPDEVAGMVLVDSSHEGQRRRFGPSVRRYFLWRTLQAALSPLGLQRLAASLDPRRKLEAELARKVPAGHVAAARALALSSRVRRADVREMVLVARSHGSPPDLGSLPLTVITAASKDPLTASVWPQLQAELMASSTRSRQMLADTGHYVHYEDPALVIKAVCDMLASAR